MQASTARPDAFVIAETVALGGSLFDDNGSGADSGDGGTLAVATVNGSAGNVGTTITLGSGAFARTGLRRTALHASPVSIAIARAVGTR